MLVSTLSHMGLTPATVPITDRCITICGSENDLAWKGIIAQEIIAHCFYSDARRSGTVIPYMPAFT